MLSVDGGFDDEEYARTLTGSGSGSGGGSQLLLPWIGPPDVRLQGHYPYYTHALVSVIITDEGSRSNAEMFD